jgi:hypothetical protein
VAAENFGGLWRTMARDRRRVACRICAYALAAPLGERRHAEKTKKIRASCLPHRIGEDIRVRVG